MKIFGFLSCRGGSGKTTLAWTISNILSLKYKVGYLDLDLLGLGEGIQTSNNKNVRNKKTITDFFLDPIKEDFNYKEYSQDIDIGKGNEIVFNKITAFFPSKFDSEQLTKIESLYANKNSTKNLDNHLGTLINKIAKAKSIDYLIIDFPGYFRNPVINWYEKINKHHKAKFVFVTGFNVNEIITTLDFITERDYTNRNMVVINKYFSKMRITDEDYTCSFVPEGKCQEDRICQKRGLINNLHEEELTKSINQLNKLAEIIREKKLAETIHTLDSLGDPSYLKLAKKKERDYKNIAVEYFPESHYLSLTDKLGCLCTDLTNITSHSQYDKDYGFNTKDERVIEKAIEIICKLDSMV